MFPMQMLEYQGPKESWI